MCPGTVPAGSSDGCRPAPFEAAPYLSRPPSAGRLDSKEPGRRPTPTATAREPTEKVSSGSGRFLLPVRPEVTRPRDLKAQSLPGEVGAQGHCAVQEPPSAPVARLRGPSTAPGSELPPSSDER